jgi:hypothetical protein
MKPRNKLHDAHALALQEHARTKVAANFVHTVGLDLDGAKRLRHGGRRRLFGQCIGGAAVHKRRRGLVVIVRDGGVVVSSS